MDKGADFKLEGYELRCIIQRNKGGGAVASVCGQMSETERGDDSD